MTPICITNSGTKIYSPEPGYMGGGTFYKVEKTVGVIELKSWYSRDQIKALVKREGIKEGKIE